MRRAEALLRGSWPLDVFFKNWLHWTSFIKNILWVRENRCKWLCLLDHKKTKTPVCIHIKPPAQTLLRSQTQQDSWAIAKKTARCSQYMGALKSLESPHYAPDYTFPEICSRLLFRSILRMCAQKLKFVALPVPGIIGGTQKIWAVPVYAHAPFSPKFLIVFCSHGPSE